MQTHNKKRGSKKAAAEASPEKPPSPESDKNEVIDLLASFLVENVRRKVMNIYTAFCKQNTGFMKELAQHVAQFPTRNKKGPNKLTPYVIRKHSMLRFETLPLDQQLYWIKRARKTIEIEES